jgi:hypothetical protein
MSSDSSKPKQQTYSTGGLYGSATTGGNGSTYNPTDFEKNLVNATTSAIPQYLQQMINPSYDSEVFKAQTAQRNKLANQSFENNLINPLANRGLTRGSSVNQLSGMFANKLADAEVAAMANEDARVQNILNSLLSTYQMPYNMMQGMTNATQSLYGQELQRVAQENANKNSMMNSLIQAGGMVAGAYLGNPALGAAAGKMVADQTA